MVFQKIYSNQYYTSKIYSRSYSNSYPSISNTPFLDFHIHKYNDIFYFIKQVLQVHHHLQSKHPNLNRFVLNQEDILHSLDDILNIYIQELWHIFDSLDNYFQSNHKERTKDIQSNQDIYHRSHKNFRGNLHKYFSLFSSRSLIYLYHHKSMSLKIRCKHGNEGTLHHMGIYCILCICQEIFLHTYIFPQGIISLKNPNLIRSKQEIQLIKDNFSFLIVFFKFFAILILVNTSFNFKLIDQMRPCIIIIIIISFTIIEK